MVWSPYLGAVGLHGARAFLCGDGGMLGARRHLEGFSEGPGRELPPDEVALRVFGCALLLSCSALCSGLTLGVMGLDTNQLDILRQSGGPKERVWAERILEVRRDGNLLLCTLLWANMSVNSLLSIIIADLTSGLAGFIISTVLIVVLGEIIPQVGGCMGKSCERHDVYVCVCTHEHVCAWSACVCLCVHARVCV